MRFRKKPVEIEAMQVPDDLAQQASLMEWIEGQGGEVFMTRGGSHLSIRTLEGVMRADVGDWVIRGVQGEFYPCKPEIFEQTYEPVS